MTIPGGAGARAGNGAQNERRFFAAAEIVYVIARVSSVVAATLREIFDESPYQRFLKRSGIPSSSAAYAMFQRENNQTKARRPRCC